MGLEYLADRYDHVYLLAAAQAQRIRHMALKGSPGTPCVNRRGLGRLFIRGC